MSIHEVSDDGQEILASGSNPNLAATEDAPMLTENSQPVAAPPTAQHPRTLFGLAQDHRAQNPTRPVFNDDYVARFPEDPYGQEAAPNARIWRVYVEEAATFDENMVGQSRDGLDVMLVFAGLFSAVVTSFLVQVSQNLQADFTEMSALLLHDLLLVQLSMADGAAVNITTPSVNPAQNFDPDAIDVWINALWVISLTTSLVVALAAVLVKQWLHRYMTFPSGTPGLRSHVRQFRFMGLEKWRVRIIIGMLPIVMHISLLLFFVGLALFYVPLRTSLAWVIGTITMVVSVLYLVSNTIPIFFPQCPYQTPLTDFIHHVCQVIPLGVQSIRHYCSIAFRGTFGRTVPFFTTQDVSPIKLRSLTELESDSVRDAHDTLSVDALDWLYQMSSNPNVHTLVLQGVSGLPDESRSYAVMKWREATDIQTQRHQLVREASQTLDFPGQSWVVERLCRSSLFLPMGTVTEGVLVQDILIEKSREIDPRIEAVIWLAYGQWPFYDYSGFFISHSEVLMPPLIWEEIVLRVLHHYSHPQDVWQGISDESSLAQVLTLVIIPPLATNPSVLLMTGPQVVWTRLQSHFWDIILGTSLLAPHDSVSGAHTVSSYHRCLVAAGKLALSHRRQYRFDMDDVDGMDKFAIVQLQLLACIVRSVAGDDVKPATDYWKVDIVIEFLVSILQEFRDVSFKSESNSNPLPVCLDDIRSFYVQSASMSEFRFVGLDSFLQSWAGLYDCVQYDSVFSEHRPSELETPLNLLGDALSRGHEVAYRIFTSRGWMEILFTKWAICGDKYGHLCRVIEGYVEGLYIMTLDSNRREFGRYLHEPRQLMLAFMLIVATGTEKWEYSPIENLVVQLAQICPSHTSWDECETALSAILEWTKSPNPDISCFPWPPSLQSLDSIEAFRKYPLVEWTARRFASEVTQIQLNVGLVVLRQVWENADTYYVDEILIPDLEDEISIEAPAPSSQVPALEL